MKTERRTSEQREKIFSIIKGSTSHPSAQWIYDAVRKEMPSVSMGNVYRNIRILIEEGRIQGMDTGDGIEHYEAVTSPHYHFICEKCDLITDISMPIMDKLDKKVISKTGFKVKRHRIEFYGLCNNCRE
jgi:Fur family transcriptional regulator, peroxide stress response regulator